MEKTLVHEDIYAYIDPIKDKVESGKGTFIEFVNDARESVVDNGVFNITITSGSFSKLVLNDGYKDIEIIGNFSLNSFWVLDFRNMHFTKDGSLFFIEDVFDLKDNEYNVLTLEFTGTGEAEVDYMFRGLEESSSDLMYLESLSIDSSLERQKKILLTGQEKILNSEKKVHSFSINGLWNQQEIAKFTDNFRIRLVDEEGTKLETLANCYKNSVGKSSSSNGDLTYAISGSCEKIF